MIKPGGKEHKVAFRDQLPVEEEGTSQEEAKDEKHIQQMKEYQQLKGLLPDRKSSQKRQALNDVYIVDSYKEYNQVEPYNAQCCNIL